MMRFLLYKQDYDETVPRYLDGCQVVLRQFKILAKSPIDIRCLLDNDYTVEDCAYIANR